MQNIEVNQDTSAPRKEYTAKEVIAALSGLMPFVFPHRGKLSIVIFLLMISVAVSVSIGFGLKYILEVLPKTAEEGLAFLDQLLLIVVTVISVTALLRFTANYLLQKISTMVTEKVRSDVFSNIVSQNIEYIEGHFSGDMQTRIIADTNSIGRFLTMQAPLVLSAVMTMLGGVIGALYIDATLTFVVLAFAPLIFLPFVFYSKKLRRLGELVQTSIANMGRSAGETFRNIKVTKAYNKEQNEKDRFAGLAGTTTKLRLQSLWLQMVLKTVVGAVASIASVCLFWFIARSIYDGETSLGQLMAFIYFSRLIVSSAQQFVGIYAAVNVFVGKARKILEFLNKEMVDWNDQVIEREFKGGIQFRGVTFSYPNRPNEVVLKGINLKINPGSRVAIVGPSGAGKSTLFDLLLRFYEPQQGGIHIDGVDIKDLSLSQLRQMTGFVPQKESLISGSVYDNISYGCHDATSESAKEAATKAYADKFIERLPKGYKTDIGEVGGRLSGGQKQRISLARALVRNPQILLLDEANSALDRESERNVAKAIKEWAERERRTVITIAHRLASAHDADMIIVMNNGSVIATGTHRELMNSCEFYRRLNISSGDSVETTGGLGTLSLETV